MTVWHWLYIPGVIIGWEIAKRVLSKVTGFGDWSRNG
jgi:hypothetical protein